MNKVVRHPSAKKTASLVLRELLDDPPVRLAVMMRNEAGELEIACCDEWDNEDLALSIAMLQVWFNQLVVGDDE